MKPLSSLPSRPLRHYHRMWIRCQIRICFNTHNLRHAVANNPSIDLSSTLQIHVLKICNWQNNLERIPLNNCGLILNVMGIWFTIIEWQLILLPFTPMLCFFKAGGGLWHSLDRLRPHEAEVCYFSGLSLTDFYFKQLMVTVEFLWYCQQIILFTNS